MQIKKSSLETIFNAVKGTEGLLTLAESRIRDPFLKELADVTQTFITDREAIYKAYCLKNEAGEPDLLEGSKYQFKPEDKTVIESELKTLFEETVELDVTSEMQDITSKTAYSPKYGEAEIIDDFIKQF